MVRGRMLEIDFDRGEKKCIYKTDKMIVGVTACDENNPLKADVPETYLAVLTGKEKFICATEEGQKYRIDGNSILNREGEEIYQILYFSKADMEGDGKEVGDITKDGVFKTGYPYVLYARITSFAEDGCRIETVEGYDISKHERIRYYYFSEEAIAQWLD